MRRRNDPFEKPWIIIAAVVGIIAVIGIALIFFMGGGSSAPAASAGGTQTTSASPSAQQTGAVPSVVRTQAPVEIPAEGVYVRVSYIGGFTGSYGMAGNMTDTRNSGDRLFVVENATGTVSAAFHKEDASTRHEIAVEIYKDGKSLAAARNSSSYGEASVSSPV